MFPISVQTKQIANESNPVDIVIYVNLANVLDVHYCQLKHPNWWALLINFQLIDVTRFNEPIKNYDV